MKTKVIQWSIQTLLVIWGFASFLILAGEDAPGHPMSDETFFGTKAAGAASLAICLAVGGYLDRNGYLPKSKHTDTKTED